MLAGHELNRQARQVAGRLLDHLERIPVAEERRIRIHPGIIYAFPCRF